MKWVTNENLLYSTRNSTQSSAVTQMGRKSKKEGNVYKYSWFTLLYTMSWNYTLIKVFKNLKKKKASVQINPFSLPLIDLFSFIYIY